MKCCVILVITGATGIVTKELKKYLETIPERIQSIFYTKQTQKYHT